MPAVSEKQRRAMEAAAHGHSTLGIPQKVGKEFVAADSAGGDCAGILFRAPGPLYLLLRRTDSGEWAQPGGHLKGSETPEEAACRECVEEIGTCPDGIRWAVRRNAIPKGKGIFTCYLQNVPEPFEPELNDEHDNWGWFAPDALPSPMHRKVAETIARVTGNELDIAQRMSKGELLSPQRYENVWLFDLRITGTGTSYRIQLDEYVYRPPENFLTKEFVARCNGLPLIFEHPKDQAILDTEEFRNRSVGTVFLPYIKDAEVRGIVKVFDADAAQLMRTSHASTSPAVVFRDAGSSETVQLDDGSTVLIEGKPSYLDSLAICEEGVWDKGGQPTGVNNSGDPIVDENEEKVPAWADALVKRMDEVHARLDALDHKDEEKKDGESEREREEAAKKGAEEHKEREEHEERKDRKDARKDAEREDSEEKAEREGEDEEKEEHKAGEALKEAEKDGEKERKAEERADSQARKIADLESKLNSVTARLGAVTKPLSAEDRDGLAKAQARADGVASMFGDSVRPPLHGENPIQYRKALASKFQKHSASVKDVKLDSLDAQSFAIVENQIYADAQAAARTSVAATPGRLIEHRTVDIAGRPIYEFTGDPLAAWAPFMGSGITARINRMHQGA